MRRHDLVYLQREAAFTTPCAAPGSPGWLALRDWIAKGRPLVAARQAAGSAGILLGLTLPLDQGRQRLTVCVSREAIATVQPPLRAVRCLHRLSSDLAPVLQTLAASVEGSGASLGIYGSLAWESLSGEAYRHADSDIDVICDVATPAQLAQTLAALQEAAAALHCRLDGEIRFPDGQAASWRELAAAKGRPDAQVLVKGESSVSLLPIAALLGALDREPCHA